MDTTPRPSDTLDAADRAWIGSAHRASRLQLTQLIILLLFGGLAALTSLVVLASVGSVRTAQNVDQEILAGVVSIRDRIQTEHVNYWVSLAHDGTGVTNDARELALTGPGIVRGLAQRDENAHPGRASLGWQVARRVDELGVVVRELEVLGPGRGADPLQRRDAMDALIKDIGGLSSAWIAVKQRDVAAALDRAGATGLRWMILVFGALVALGAAATTIWVRLGRSRSRLVHSLEDAAQRLADQARVDQLTGLAGHAVFHDRLAAEVDLARQRGEPLALVLMDLDHFKAINDSFGHQAGDRVLRGFAEFLRASCRTDELVARVGGEEFAWLLPGQTAHEAFLAAERMRARIAGVQFGGVQVTLSAGVCDLSVGPDVDAAELYRLTDGALYWAKAHGRNVTFCYTPEVVEELSAAERAERLERRIAVNTVVALARAVDAKDPTTQRHSERVAELARMIALELGWTATDAAVLHEAALVHDVGKIGLADAILFKPGPLTARERLEVQTHAALGAQIVSGVLSDEQTAWVRGHHERLDGKGYPDGLVDVEIADGAKIMAIADAWDAMTSERPYSSAVPIEVALHRTIAASGTQFWPPAVAALETIVAAGRLPKEHPSVVGVDVLR